MQNFSRILLLSLLFSSTFAVNSQALESYFLEMDSIVEANAADIKEISTSLSTNAKDVYLNEDWEHGVIITKENTAIFFNGRLNIARGYLECKVENRLRRITSSKVKLVELEGKRFIPVKASSMEGGIINTYLQVLSTGSINLVKEYVIDIEYQSTGNSLFPEMTGQKNLEIESVFYSSSDLTSFDKLKSNKKSILQLLSAKNDDIERLIDINRLKFSSERDITTIFNYYNTIN